MCAWGRITWRAVVQPLQRSAGGHGYLSLSRLSPGTDCGPQLEAMGMSVEMTSGVLVAEHA